MSAFVHYELNTSDPKAAKRFYKSVFGWKSEDMKMPGGVYTMLKDAAGESVGGLQQHPMPGSPSGWLGYVGVPSHKRAMAKAKKAGATIVVDKMEIPGMGTFGIFVDPQGATVAVWEQAAAAPAKKAAKKKVAKKAAKKKVAKKAPKKAANKRVAKKAPKKAANKRVAKKR